MEKSNILLIGPSGSGKTHLVKSLASYLNIPLVIGNATSLTEAGYVGDDVECLLSRLIQAANGDVNVAQQGIVFIDEIDKIKRAGLASRIMRQGVQHALLRSLKARSPRCHRRAVTSILSAWHPLRHDQRPVYLRGAFGVWKISSPRGSGGAGLGSVSCPKIASGG